MILVAQRSHRWSLEAKMSTNNFLDYLISEDYEKLYIEYVQDDSISKEKFVGQFDLFEEKYGSLASYEYRYYTSSKSKSKYTSFNLYYNLYTENDKYLKGTFWMKIDKIMNKPYLNVIDRFSISRWL